MVNKTYVGVCVFIDSDGSMRPERIALGNNLYGITNVASVATIEKSATLDYTVEIWAGPGQTRTSHLYMEKVDGRSRWYVMRKERRAKPA